MAKGKITGYESSQAMYFAKLDDGRSVTFHGHTRDFKKGDRIEGNVTASHNSGGSSYNLNNVKKI